MFGTKIWDFYASWYEKLWVQKFVLKPSRRLIIETLNVLPFPKRILDVGCGIGQLCNDLKNQFPPVIITGIDISSKMIERAKSLYNYSEIRFISGQAEDLPENETYDYIVSTHAFPYIEDKKKFLAEMKKRLNPNGRLFLIFGNNNNLYDACVFKIVKLTTSKAEYLSVEKTSKLLNESGFKTGKIKRIKSAFFIPSVYLIEGINIG